MSQHEIVGITEEGAKKWFFLTQHYPDLSNQLTNHMIAEHGSPDGQKISVSGVQASERKGHIIYLINQDKEHLPLTFPEK